MVVTLSAPLFPPVRFVDTYYILMLTENIGLTYGIINDTNGEINWRIPMATQGVPCIVVLVFVWFLPESPRWLMSRGRTLEARNILAK
jgi:lipoprotein signal peptidase